MGVPTSEVGYASATTGRGDHEVHKEHVVAMKIYIYLFIKLKLGWHPVVVVQYTYTHKQYTEQHIETIHNGTYITIRILKLKKNT
jgi:hypothetical protein